MYRPGIAALALVLTVLPCTALASPLPGAKAPLPDLEVSGEDVRIEPGERVHNVRVLGGDLLVLGEVTGSLSSFGGDVALRGPVLGDVQLLGGDLLASSTIHGDVKLLGGDARIVGLVRGDVDATGGDVELAEGARVLGKVHEGGGGLDLDALSAFLPTPAWFRQIIPGMVSVTTALSIVAKLLTWAAAWCLGLLFLAVDRLRFGTYQESLTLASLPSLGWGVLASIAVLAIAGLCVLTFIGAPIAGLLMCTLVAAHHLGLALTAAAVGATLPSTWLATRAWAQLCVGTVLCVVATLVPYLGGLLLVLASFAGLGAVVISHMKPRLARPLPLTTLSAPQG